MFGISVQDVEARDWLIYEGTMPKHWEPQFGNLLYHATQYWQDQFESLAKFLAETEEIEDDV